MIFSKETSACKRAFLLILFSTFFTLFIGNYIYAQVPTEIPDLPIDPNSLKNASPSELQELSERQ